MLNSWQGTTNAIITSASAMADITLEITTVNHVSGKNLWDAVPP